VQGVELENIHEAVEVGFVSELISDTGHTRCQVNQTVSTSLQRFVANLSGEGEVLECCHFTIGIHRLGGGIDVRDCLENPQRRIRRGVKDSGGKRAETEIFKKAVWMDIEIHQGLELGVECRL
jgi:hypothetical protein